jgi:adenylate cyclase
MTEPKRSGGLLSYRISLVVAIPLLVLLTGALIAGNSYVTTRAGIGRLANSLFTQIGEQTADQARSHVRQASPAVDLLAASLSDEDAIPPSDELAVRLLAVLRANSGFAWVAFSDEAGAFTGAQRTADGSLAVKQSHIEGGKTTMDEHAVAKDGTWSLMRHADDTRFDPRTRPFYTNAVAAKKRVWIDPYVLAGRRAPGMTCAAPVYGKDGKLRGVVSVDFDLETLSAFVATLHPSPNARVFIYTDSGIILAHPSALAAARSGKGAEDALVTRDNIPDDVVRQYFRSAGAGSFDYQGARYLSATRSFNHEGLKWNVGAVAPESDFMGDVSKATRFSLITTVIAVIFAMLLAATMANRVAAPLVHLASEMDKVGRFELADAAAPPTIFKEIALMNRALAAMKLGLASFGVYVPRDLVRAVLASGVRAELGGKTKPLTVFFSDLAGFTTLSEGMSPDALVKLLSGYFDEMTRVISARRGTVDKFIGDGIMAFWNAPHDEPDHAVLACEAALACQRKLDEMKKSDPSLSRVSARIGIATGDALVGNIGSSDRMNYTAMGDTVNLAARLEGLGKVYGTRILVSETCRNAAKDTIVMRAVDVVAVKGKKVGVRVYEPLALVRDSNNDAEAVSKLSELALDAYLARRWDEAIGLFESILTLFPDDVAASTLRDRARGYSREPPAANWSGAWVMKEK